MEHEFDSSRRGTVCLVVSHMKGAIGRVDILGMLCILSVDSTCSSTRLGPHTNPEIVSPTLKIIANWGPACVDDQRDAQFL